MVTKRTVLILGVAVILPTALIAQFGFSVVSDPTQEAHSWTQVLNDIQKIKLATSTYEQITAAYNLAMVAAQYIPGTRKYTFETLAQALGGSEGAFRPRRHLVAGNRGTGYRRRTGAG